MPQIITRLLRPCRVPVFLFVAALALGACGGGGGAPNDDDPPIPAGPDTTPPTLQINTPTGERMLISGETYAIGFTANDDRDAEVTIFLDRDGSLATDDDQTVLYTGTDRNGTPLDITPATTGVDNGRHYLFGTIDDGTHAPVEAVGPSVFFYPGLAGVAPTLRNAYGVATQTAVFGVGEAAHGGADRNGDSDQGDAVVTLIDVLTGQEQNTGLTVDVTGGVGTPVTRVLLSREGFVPWVFREADAGQSFNLADMDANDTIVGFASLTPAHHPVGGATLVNAGVGARTVVLYNEASASLDLNADGDQTDVVVSVLDLGANASTTFAPEIKAGTTFRGSLQGFGVYLTDETQSGAFAAGSDWNTDGDTLDVLPVLIDVNAPGPISISPATVDATAAFTSSTDAPLAVYYVNEALTGGGTVLNADGDSTDYIPAVDVAGTVFYPGAGLNAGMGARYAFGDRQILVYLAADETVPLADRNGDGDTTDQEVLHYTDVSVSPTTSTPLVLVGSGLGGLALDGGFAAHVAPGWLSLVVSETANGTDFTGDLDTGDLVLMLVDLTGPTPVVHNTGLSPLDPTTLAIPGATIPITGVGGPAGLVVQAIETANGDLNGDLDATDTLLFFFPFASAPTRIPLTDTGGLHAWVGQEYIAVTAYEALTSEDFDGDGDTTGFVFRVFRTTGAVREAGLPSDERSIPTTDDDKLWAYLRSEMAEGQDLNGDGDLVDLVLGLWTP